ncbi:MAG: hypothetical protein LT103_03330 [Burkholderiaceae bacterium]|nr:hypothetical protein [Burkholderiaceae bacterium]
MNATTAALRIWIAVDALDRSADVLGAAMRLAAGRAVELAGLFVEDADLLRLAGWPSATETRLFEASLRQVGGAELEAALRAQALALQRRLDALARDIGVPWSFRTARGRVVQQALHLAGSGDWIVLASAATGLRLRLAAPRTRPVVWLLPDDEAGLSRLLAAAVRYDPQGSAERRVVLPADAARAAQLRAAPQAATGAVRFASEAELIARAACGPAAPGDLVLMTRDSGAADPQRLGRLLRRGVGPLALV